MAYCVHCGVELAPSEKACPLCQTMVIHPTEPWREPTAYPFPAQLEAASHPINRRFGAYLATLVLLVPVVLTLLMDLFQQGMLTWSPFVLGACACIFVFGILPFFLRPQKPYLCLALDVLALGLYLLVIGYLIGHVSWVTELGLPIVGILGALLLLTVYIARRRAIAPLDQISMIVFLVGIALVLLEVVIDLFISRGTSLRLGWSVIALVPLSALSVAFRLIERRKKLKDSILKRLYL